LGSIFQKEKKVVLMVVQERKEKMTKQPASVKENEDDAVIQ